MRLLGLPVSRQHGVLAVYGVGDNPSPVLPGQFLAYSGQFRPIQIERVPSRCSSGQSSRSSPVPPAARVGEQFGDLGSFCPLANFSARREGAGLLRGAASLDM
jgi:hypothetical protein